MAISADPRPPLPRLLNPSLPLLPAAPRVRQQPVRWRAPPPLPSRDPSALPPRPPLPSARLRHAVPEPSGGSTDAVSGAGCKRPGALGQESRLGEGAPPSSCFPSIAALRSRRAFGKRELPEEDASRRSCDG